ncbi:SDR family oxidoreductase [Sorangium sp. So ce542]|uniref:SDR family oxidoreductase n=1 Tax=Sorangium sp. So ce542 TaxID=3133316 RepID=UPI003F5E25E4
MAHAAGGRAGQRGVNLGATAARPAAGRPPAAAQGGATAAWGWIAAAAAAGWLARALRRVVQRVIHRPRVVVITGASAGVGRAAARAFAAQGARIGLLARGADGLEAARREVEAAGGAALVLPADVADAEQIERAVDEVERVLGPIDVWVNNAMVSVFSPVSEMRPEEYRRVTEVTYLGYVYGTLAALRRMRPRDRGVIVQVGSALAHRAIPLQSAYCAAKHAIKGFTESLRCELFHDRSNVRVTQVDMPALNTPQFEWVKSRLPTRAQPVPPIFQPEIAADAILFAADHGERKMMWVGWPTVKAVLGNRIIPALLDRYLASKGYESQQTGEPLPEGRKDNLWAPVPGDHGAHGRFDARARGRSLALWVVAHRAAVALSAGLATIALVRAAIVLVRAAAARG